MFGRFFTSYHSAKNCFGKVAEIQTTDNCNCVSADSLKEQHGHFYSRAILGYLFMALSPCGHLNLLIILLFHLHLLKCSAWVLTDAWRKLYFCLLNDVKTLIRSIPPRVLFENSTTNVLLLRKSKSSWTHKSQWNLREVGILRVEI